MNKIRLLAKFNKFMYSAFVFVNCVMACLFALASMNLFATNASGVAVTVSAKDPLWGGIVAFILCLVMVYGIILSIKDV